MKKAANKKKCNAIPKASVSQAVSSITIPYSKIYQSIIWFASNLQDKSNALLILHDDFYFGCPIRILYPRIKQIVEIKSTQIPALCSILYKYPIIYCSGGNLEGGASEKTFYSINLTTMYSNQLPNIPISKYYHAIILHQRNYIVQLCGFTNNEEGSADCEYYNILKNKWEAMPYASEKKMHVAGISIGNSIYMIGGTKKEAFVNTVEKTDTAHGLKTGWVRIKIEIAPKLFIKGSIGFAISNTEIVITGGTNNNTSVVLNTLKNTIANYKPLHCSTYYSKSNGIIYLTSQERVDVYDTKQWKSAKLSDYTLDWRLVSAVLQCDYDNSE